MEVKTKIKIKMKKTSKFKHQRFEVTKHEIQ
jgi:hypothetical protein